MGLIILAACCSTLALFVTESWKTYLSGIRKLFQLKISTIVWFAHLDKTTIKPSCYEDSHPQLPPTIRYG